MPICGKIAGKFSCLWNVAVSPKAGCVSIEKQCRRLDIGARQVLSLDLRIVQTADLRRKRHLEIQWRQNSGAIDDERRISREASSHRVGRWRYGAAGERRSATTQSESRGRSGLEGAHASPA